jgi:hypothetical protein
MKSFALHGHCSYIIFGSDGVVKLARLFVIGKQFSALSSILNFLLFLHQFSQAFSKCKVGL